MKEDLLTTKSLPHTYKPVSNALLGIPKKDKHNNIIDVF